MRYLTLEALPGWPERLPARTWDRAETLVAARWVTETASEAAAALAAHAACGGPDAVPARLDGLANQQASFTDLPTSRRRSSAPPESS